VLLFEVRDVRAEICRQLSRAAFAMRIGSRSADGDK
jgi:hypothetical protein